jgi:predicted Rossmann fold nucleotide-binding protein DprA/Smf involved in DNA uptake
MREEQRVAVKRLLAQLRVSGDDEFHYGACIGADSQAVLDAIDAGYTILAYPANNVPQAKQGLIPQQAILFKPRAALTRNKRIVDNSDILIVAPQRVSEQLRSGTWATVRYARKQGKPIIYVWPSGEVQRT